MTPEMRMRLPARDGEVLDRSRIVTFRWDGQLYRAYPGDTIASALAATGVRVFSRSFKYHRPRGLLTGDIHDPACLFEVDGEPNVRGAHRLAEDGMDVRTQNVWPSLRLDAKRLSALTAPFTGPGFYYKTFMSPRALRPLYRHVLSRFSPGGRLPTEVPPEDFDKRFMFADVVVAGGGPAGMSAAIAAAEAGVSVLLVELEHGLGGHLRYGDGAALAELARLRARIAELPGVEVLTDSVVLGRYDGNWLGIVDRSPDGPVRERLLKGRPRAFVVATGLIGRPALFRGNDLPGVMLPGAATRLVNLYAVRPGDRAVVETASPEAAAAAAALADAGVEVIRVDPTVSAVRAARGRGRLQLVELTDGSRVGADLLVASGGWTAPVSLLGVADGRPALDEDAGRFVPTGGLPDGVFATGGLAGEGTLEELLAHGAATGALAAAHAGSQASAAIAPRPLRRPAPVARRGLAPMAIVDFAEDVSAKDIVAAAAEGYDSVELNKRYTTTTMGTDQGRLSAANMVDVLAATTGRTRGATGTTTSRPPFVPVSLGALAGRRFVPYRVTPMDSWHRAHGARLIRTGDWLRPESYGDPLGEVQAVRNGVGVMDVTTLGKLDLRGRDVVRLLDLVYINRWTSLAVGSVRYGAMVGDDGVLIDDGVTGRLAEDRYLMSTTSSGSERIRRWLEYWLQVEHPDWNVFLTPMTDAYAAMNVAGPRARELVARIVEGVDLDNAAFPYMSVRPGTVAGVEGCFMWRIGFTGELSYELYIPAGHGLHVWDRLFEAGADLGIRAFGVEAQKTMRIEKGHAVIGQDTDALTGPFAAGLGWAVKEDKPLTVGQRELAWQRANPDALRSRLVGLQTKDPKIVPAEACQIMSGGRVIGRVTSSRFSPTLGRSVALALIEPSVAGPGQVVDVRLTDGHDAPAIVQERTVHLDPEGARLRV